MSAGCNAMRRPQGLSGRAHLLIDVEEIHVVCWRSGKEPDLMAGVTGISQLGNSNFAGVILDTNVRDTLRYAVLVHDGQVDIDCKSVRCIAAGCERG